MKLEMSFGRCAPDVSVQKMPVPPPMIRFSAGQFAFSCL